MFTGPSPQENILPISINDELPNSDSSISPFMGTIIYFIYVIALLISILFFLPDRLLVPVLFKDQPKYYYMLLIYIGFAVGFFRAVIIEHMPEPMPKDVRALSIVTEFTMLSTLVIVTLLCFARLS